ncbi:peptidase inhibitor family I36 protein [Solicola gregarius]|uniref:peptidase inhibitor family I36 protein n=1 Tax=Solicola gregarius TaxID=2908642 RepID=UPI0038CD1128
MTLSVPASSAATPSPGLENQPRVSVSADGWDRCPHGNLCLFDLPNGEGDFLAYSSATGVPALGAWDNRISSVWNRSPYYADTFRNPDFQGEMTSWDRYGMPVNLSIPGSDNSISSFQLRL